MYTFISTTTFQTARLVYGKTLEVRSVLDFRELNKMRDSELHK